jgi:hypothetical protein
MQGSVFQLYNTGTIFYNFAHAKLALVILHGVHVGGLGRVRVLVNAVLLAAATGVAPGR